jgi:uncharacterized LabA/DUF88 family protein
MPAGAKYAFIDGAYLRENYRAAIAKWSPGTASELSMDRIRISLSAEKVFYYDCEDTKKANETDEVFKKRKDEQDRLFTKFKRSFGCQLRFGVLSGGKKRVQKRVDILLAVDMLSHAARQNFATAALVAGDQDFVPLVESLLNMGIFVELYGDRFNTQAELIDVSDAFEPTALTTYYRWTESNPKSESLPPIPRIQSGPLVPVGLFQEIKKGSLAGRPATLYAPKNTGVAGFRMEFETIDGHLYNTTDADRERLMLFCEMEIGKADGF